VNYHDFDVISGHGRRLEETVSQSSNNPGHNLAMNGSDCACCVRRLLA
jgi:hypothetical protein